MKKVYVYGENGFNSEVVEMTEKEYSECCDVRLMFSLDAKVSDEHCKRFGKAKVVRTAE